MPENIIGNIRGGQEETITESPLTCIGTFLIQLSALLNNETIDQAEIVTLNGEFVQCVDQLKTNI